MIEVNELSFGYKKNNPIFNKLSFTVNNSESLIILGGNGIGKSTLLNIISGNIQDYSGTVEINHKSIKSYSVHDLAQQIAVVLSSGMLFQDLSVQDFLVTGFANQIGLLHTPSSECIDTAYSVIEKLGKTELFYKPITHISAGELQIVRIARALIQQPQTILLDEPTSNLDVHNQLMIIETIQNLSEQGYTIVMTSHNPGHVFEMECQVLLLEKGKYTFGSAENVITEENLERVYGCKARILTDNAKRDIISFFDEIENHSLYY